MEKVSIKYEAWKWLNYDTSVHVHREYHYPLRTLGSPSPLDSLSQPLWVERDHSLKLSSHQTAKRWHPSLVIIIILNINNNFTCVMRLQNGPAVKRAKTFSSTTKPVTKPAKVITKPPVKTTTFKSTAVRSSTRATKAPLKAPVTKCTVSKTKTSSAATSGKAPKRPAWDLKGQLQVGCCGIYYLT